MIPAVCFVIKFLRVVTYNEAYEVCNSFIPHLITRHLNWIKYMYIAPAKQSYLCMDCMYKSAIPINNVPL